MALGPMIAAHEGLQKEFHSHTWFFEDGMPSQLPSLERLVGIEASTFSNLITTTDQAVYNAALEHSKLADDPTYNTATISCTFLWGTPQ